MTLVRSAAQATVLTLIAATVAFAQTQNTIPKYGTGGALVNSAVVEVSGNVGIGLPTPGQKLDVNGDSRLQGIVYVGSGTGNGILTYNSSAFYVAGQSGKALQLGSDAR